MDVQVASREDGSPEVAWGDTFLFHNLERSADGRLFPFATIVTKDYEGFDIASNLNRGGVFRLNIGLSRESYEALFPVDTDEYDFSTLDRLMPHPVYGRNHWVCVLNPSEVTFERLKPLLTEAYERAVQRYRLP